MALVDKLPELAAHMPEVHELKVLQTGSGDGAFDALSNFLARVLAVADRLDTLAGGFAAGQKPSGNKDPFALRRNALGLARTLIEGQMECSLTAMLGRACELVALDMAGKGGEKKAAALQQVSNADPAMLEELTSFVLDRLRSYYADQGFNAAQFDAVATLGKDNPAGSPVSSLLDFDHRLRAIAEFSSLPEAPALAAANKRIRNILRKFEGVIPAQVDRALLAEPVEHTLADAVDAASRDTDPLLAARDYVGVLRRLAALRAPVDAFFDGVMVMADDPAVRGNRLALLARLADRFAAVAAVEQLSNA